jgi:hypothetical protein
VKRAAFRIGEAYWPQAVEERGQSYQVIDCPLLRFSSAAVLWVEELLEPPWMQQERPCYLQKDLLLELLLRARVSHRPAVCSS